LPITGLRIPHYHFRAMPHTLPAHRVTIPALRTTFTSPRRIFRRPLHRLKRIYHGVAPRPRATCLASRWHCTTAALMTLLTHAACRSFHPACTAGTFTCTRRARAPPCRALCAVSSLRMYLRAAHMRRFFNSTLRACWDHTHHGSPPRTAPRAGPLAAHRTRTCRLRARLSCAARIPTRRRLTAASDDRTSTILRFGTLRTTFIPLLRFAPFAAFRLPRLPHRNNAHGIHCYRL